MWGAEKAWMSLMQEKSPTVSKEAAVGILIGMGMPLYTTRVSYSCVSRGRAYRGGRTGSFPFFGGDSGEIGLSNAASDAIRCCIIWSNLSINISLVSLDCKMYRSSVDSRGSRERSIAFTASYSMARVSGYGDLKYSSSANRSKGFESSAAA